MKLITKAIEKNLPALYSTDGVPVSEKKVAVKFFTPWTNWTWYAFEGERQEDGDILFFGGVEGHEAELGYFSLRELESINGPFGLKIERDRHYSDAEWARDSKKFA
jgi:hypothetical protein